jgi:hypothetical protein
VGKGLIFVASPAATFAKARGPMLLEMNE